MEFEDGTALDSRGVERRRRTGLTMGETHTLAHARARALTVYTHARTSGFCVVRQLSLWRMHVDFRNVNGPARFFLYNMVLLYTYAYS